MKKCDCAPHLGDGYIAEPAGSEALRLNRRDFFKRVGVGAAAATCADFLGFFHRFGLPDTSRAFADSAKQIANADEPRFLIYWFIEGGWEGYDMFNPVLTPNNVLHRLADISKERYRVLHFGEPGYGIYRKGNVRYGYLAEAGKRLFDQMAVLSSMHTGQFHSGERLKAHMGSYNLRLQTDREDDERSVMQAFAEVYGQPYPLPNLSWHYWLSDGELNEAQYTGRKGYYHALGPAHAHTIYASTPANLRQFLMRMATTANDPVNREIQSFLENAHSLLRKDADLEAVKSYESARDIFLKLNAAGRTLDKSMLSQLFTDPALKERFHIKPQDELITYQSINGNKARSKFCPATNAQAMMTYELMRHGLSCAFWIESRDIRRFDSHFSRRGLWGPDGRTPRGMPDQTQMMNENLWQPLNTLVELLKSTPYKDTGKSLFDLTTIVLTSEFGRTIHGEVDAILKMNISDADKQKMIDGQDICEHWRVTSAAFLGGKVRGDTQIGSVGEMTLQAIPIMPDGSLDPAYDPVTGELLEGRSKSDKSWIPDHGDVYATALYLCDIDPQGKGRNQRGALKFLKRG